MPLSKENEVAHQAIGYAIEVHRALGPGLDKAAYLSCLAFELKNAGTTFEANVEIPVIYKNMEVHPAPIIDFLIADCVALVLDSGESIADHKIHTTLRLLHEKNLKLGLIINFNYALMKNGIRRVTNHRMLESLGMRDKPSSE